MMQMRDESFHVRQAVCWMGEAADASCSPCRRLLWQVDGDALGDPDEAAAPCVGVEAWADLGQDVQEALGEQLEVGLGNAFASNVRAGQMSQLLVQGCGISQHVDAGIQTVDNTDAMSLELGAVWVVHVDHGEQVLGLRVAGEQVLEDNLGNQHTTAGEFGAPHVVPDLGDLFPVLGGTAIIILGEGNAQHHGEN